MTDEAQRFERWLPGLAAALAFLAFLPTIEATFVNWDDETSFLTNTAYRGLGWAQLRWMLTTTFLGHWSPLTWMTWGLNYVAGGLDPWGYHLGNLLLHAANVAVLWLVARRLLAIGSSGTATGATLAAGATIAALVWGLHPLRAEAVAWASARRDVMCGLFYLLAVLAYLRGVARGAGIERRCWVLSLAAFAAALSSKTIAMTLPLTLLLLDVYPLGRRGLGWWILVREKLPYAMLAAAAGVVAFSRPAGERQHHGLHAVRGRGPPGPGGPHALVLVVDVLWPAGLSPMYELPQRVDPGHARFLGPLLAVVALTAGLVALRRRGPAGLAAWAQSVIVLAPISGVVHSGYQLAADRYSYLSALDCPPGRRRARLGPAPRRRPTGAALGGPLPGRRRAGRGGAGSDGTSADGGLARLGDALAAGGRGRSDLLSLREQSRPGGGAAGAVRGGREARAPRDRAAPRPSRGRARTWARSCSLRAAIPMRRSISGGRRRSTRPGGSRGTRWEWRSPTRGATGRPRRVPAKRRGCRPGSRRPRQPGRPLRETGPSRRRDHCPPARPGPRRRPEPGSGPTSSEP